MLWLFLVIGMGIAWLADRITDPFGFKNVLDDVDL